MKSGPTLNACTTRPRRRKASSNPSVTVVFPTPLAVPATTRMRATSGLKRPTDASRLERGHLVVDRRRRPRHVDEERAPGAFAEAEAEIEIRLEGEMGECRGVTGLRRPMRGEERVPRVRGQRRRHERGRGRDEA